ncbi:MAG TPA: hypothetical protein VFC78_24800 [Tepidisphaeraceae bacterium]|nr:hypothetical protein [Tepidisphaeraceae bacterium]
MRMGLGLISLLLGVALIAYLWSKNTTVVMQKGNEARKQVEQISGHDENGGLASDSITTQPETGPDGHLKDLLVTNLVTGGPFESFFGLQKGDKIITIGPLEVGDRYIMADDSKAAVNFLTDAYQTSKPLIVIRNGQQMTLPAQKGAPPVAASPAPAPGAGQPADAASPAPDSPAPAPTTAPTSHRETIRDQLNRIPGIKR